MEGTAVVTQIVEILVSGITGVAQGVGEGLSTLAQSIFFATSGETQVLSVMGILIIAFAGISLAEPLASINHCKNLESFNTNQSGSPKLKIFDTRNAYELNLLY